MLSENCIYGSLPPEVFKRNLTEIDISWNYLVGLVPDELYELKSLAHLNLAGNRDEGSCNRTGKDPLYVSSRGLEGNILGPSIGNLTKLKELHIYTNSFNDSISSEIGRLNQLGEYNFCLLFFQRSLW